MLIGEINWVPLAFVGIILYLAFGGVVGLIAAVLIRNANFGISAVIGMGSTVGGGLVFGLVFAIVQYISLHTSFSERIDAVLAVFAFAILLAIAVATFYVMVILIRRIGRNAPE